MAEIQVRHEKGDVYVVEVREDGERTIHRVTATSEAVTRYGGAVDAAALIEESFRFLLEREPKESILRAFEISVIERYFPDYPSTIRRRLSD